MKFSVVVVLASLSAAVSATVLPRQNAQTSLVLQSNVIAPGLANNGQDIPDPGQVASLTSTNNFINYCLTTNLPNTEGKQGDNPSCNSAPIGVIPASTKVPSLRFQSPVNQQTVRTRQPITFQIKVSNFEPGNQVNLDTNYLTAPQTLNGAGLIKGFVTVACDARTSFQDTTPPRIEAPAAFQASGARAQNGVVSLTIGGGLPAGTYRCTVTPYSTNGSPLITPKAQRGAMIDTVYIKVQ